MEEKKINVLHLRDSPWVDGPGRTILETGTQMDPADFNYIIGAFSSNHSRRNDLLEAARERDIRVFAIKERNTLDFSVIRNISGYIKQNKIDIIHTHEVRSDLIGLICAMQTRAKLVTTLHGWIGNSLKDRLKNTIDKLALHFFDMIIVVSELLKEMVLKYGIPSSRVHLLRNSIVIENFKIDRHENSFRQEFSILPDTVLIANIGRLSPEKGHKDFILAAEQVVKKFKNVTFVIIGIGPEEPALRQLVTDRQLNPFFIFTGYRTDISRIYNSLDLIVQTSYTEGMPNVILESLLMKIPVIATKVGGTPEIVKDNVTGILIEPGNISELIQKIEFFINNTYILNQMANRGKQFVERSCSYEYRTAKLSQLYRQLLSTN